MDHRLLITRSYADPATTTVVYQALSQEAAAIDGSRAQATVKQDKTRLTVTIIAADPPALRAAKRTWCSLLSAAERTIKAASDRE